MNIRRIIAVALTAMSFFSVAYARSLLLNEKNKTYTVTGALQEINASITAKANVSNEYYDITATPFIGNYIANNARLVGWAWPYSKPESYVKHHADGYILQSRGKSFLTTLYTYHGVLLGIKNKSNQPLVIDVNNSTISIGQYNGQPFYTGRFINQGENQQPNIIVPPGTMKAVVLNRADAKAINGCWIYPSGPMDFNHLKVNLYLKVNDTYVSLTADGEIPEIVQEKYDLQSQWPTV
ncbi:hypothetical protein [Acidaminococcus timonensis]|uniref:hypothetical protein n=1 Tax=Acidaminococcus timonensis TaxID=1871002 RepID=UPI0025ED567D|nr:hypothetical protein [Acidaminococcus timonensis]